jgi:DNA-binding CsgD family transcriptional regulator/tetratricopeptide (TPR) repeat protein
VRELLERERELEELHAALGEVQQGRGCSVAIEAGAGLGKTRLLREARDLGEEAGLSVLSGRATELERDFPFSLVRQLFESQIRSLSPEERRETLEGATAARGALGLDTGTVGADDPFAVLHGLYWVTATLSERNPLMLAIDDAHWADFGSLAYVDFLRPRLEELPVMLVMTVRSDEPDAPASLGPILTDPLIRHLTPTPLSVEATSTLLTHGLDKQPDAAFAAICHEVSGGNPFLLRELARNLSDQRVEPTAAQAHLVQEQVPERVARMVLMRIARLPPEAGDVARSIAVLGDGSDHSLLAAMDSTDLETTQQAADELRASAILDGGASPRFIHPLVRNAVYAEMSVGDRSRAHARAAALLRERDARPERIATQLLATEARGERRTTETLLEAGERALATGAPRSAISYLLRAMREPPPPEMRTAVLDPLLTASFRAADQAAFGAVEHEVLAEWDRDPSVRGPWAMLLTSLMAISGRFEQAASLLSDAIEASIAEDEYERAYQLQAQMSTLAAILPDLPVTPITEPVDKIDPDSPTGRLAAAMEIRALARSGTADEVVAAAKRVLGNNCSVFAEESEFAAASIAVMTLVAADEVAEARHGADRALVIASERGGTPDLVRARFLQGFVAWGEGDLIAAEADMRQSLDLARLAGVTPLVMMGVGPLIEVLIERDELDEAESELEAMGFNEGQMPSGALFGLLLMVRGKLRFEKGSFESAIEDFEALASQAEQQGYGWGPAASMSPFWVRSLLALGRQDEAGELVDEHLAFAHNWGAPSTIAHVTRAAAAARGGTEEIDLLRVAAVELDGSPRRLEHAHVLFDLGSALRRAGQRAEAREPLRRASDLARRGGAARLADRANSELAATGEKVRRYTPIGVESLTPRERRVADLAASGMTNRQIAQSLFVTVKTVEAHLSAAYGKLDIGSRRDLPGALEEAAPN